MSQDINVSSRPTHNHPTIIISQFYSYNFLHSQVTDPLHPHSINHSVYNTPHLPLLPLQTHHSSCGGRCLRAVPEGAWGQTHTSQVPSPVTAEENQQSGHNGQPAKITKQYTNTPYMQPEARQGRTGRRTGKFFSPVCLLHVSDHRHYTLYFVFLCLSVCLSIPHTYNESLVLRSTQLLQVEVEHHTQSLSNPLHKRKAHNVL